MSHFTVTVVTKERPTAEVLARALMPFHEFECTGHDNEYVRNVDILPELRGDYEKYLASEGAEPMTFAVYLEEEGGHRIVGAGEEPDLAGEHKYGWCRITDEGDVTEAVRRTNPNAKWDWYQVGGRWTGFYVIKGADIFRPLLDEKDLPMTGEPSLLDPGRVVPENRADSARKGDIDFEGMRADSAKEAAARWDKIRGIIGPHADTFETWEKVRERFGDDIAAARTAYWAQPAHEALRLANESVFGLDEYLVSRDEYVKRHRDWATRTHAFLRDGEWKENGEMGWFGVVHGEKEDWHTEFGRLLESVPDDCWLTVVDCHI